MRIDPKDLRLALQAQEEAVAAAKARARQTEQDAIQLRRQTTKELREAESERRSAREEALAQAQAELDEVRQTLRRLQRDRELPVAQRETVAERRKEADNAAEVVRAFQRTKVPVRHIPPEATIKLGDRVQIVALNQEGEVVALDDDSAEVQLGSLKLRQPLGSLRRIGPAKAESQQQRTVVKPPSVGYVPIETDIRGIRASEVEDALERYLEDAYRSGLPYVRIIHGKGTGALRKTVTDYLRIHPAVARSAEAPANEGGAGATIAHFREE
jgi:DNA mismatch repair protein MutS2